MRRWKARWLSVLILLPLASRSMKMKARKLVSIVNESGANVLLVGLGAPKIWHKIGKHPTPIWGGLNNKYYLCAM